jgi:hypothetical protein
LIRALPTAPARHRGRTVLGSVAAALVALTVSGVASVAPAASTTSGGGEWTTYGGGFTRASIQPLSPSLDPLHKLWSNGAIDGEVYGEPLIYQGRVYVATESDVVYALSARSGNVIWRRSIGRPADSNMLPCGDIGPDVGITSTMVLDAAAGRLFAVGEIDSGRVLARRDLDLSGWETAAQLQRAGLGIDDGRVLVGFGGNYGDCATYRGYLLAVPESGSGAVEVYTVPTTHGGAIWAPSGESVLSNGNILVDTGNSASSSPQSPYDGGVSVVELTPALRRVSFFAPSDWRSLNANDLDLSSSAPIAVADDQVLAAGKSGVAYLLSPTDLGGIGGQLASTPVCSSYGGDARDGGIVVIGCGSSPPVAVKIGPRSIHPLWSAPSNAGGPPTIAGGLVWTDENGELTGLRLGSGRLAVQLGTVSTEHFATPSAGEGLLVVGGASAVEAYAGPKGFLG